MGGNAAWNGSGFAPSLQPTQVCRFRIEMAPRARTEAWTDTLTGCINDVVIMRPENPLVTLGQLLADSSARPNWKESAATYAKRCARYLVTSS